MQNCDAAWEMLAKLGIGNKRQAGPHKENPWVLDSVPVL